MTNINFSLIDYCYLVNRLGLSNTVDDSATDFMKNKSLKAMILTVERVTDTKTFYMKRIST